VTLTWGSNSRVSKVRDPAGNDWLYEYDANGMLTKVTSPGTSPDIRQYYYENADSTLLTGIAVNGVRYSTYNYYSDRRVSESGLAGGEEKDSFVYGPTQTTITDARGQTTTFGFMSVFGELKLTSVSRAGTSSCTSASAQTVYNASGYPDYTLDWNGNKIGYEYDGAGRVLNVTSAAGTQAHTWAGEQIMQTEYRNGSGVAYANVVYTYFQSGFGLGLVESITANDIPTGKQRRTTFAYTFTPGGLVAGKSITNSLPGGASSTTALAYDALGRLISRTNALLQQESWSNFDGLGNARHYVDINGVSTDYTYDAKGNQISRTLNLPAGARTTTIGYNHNHQVADIVYPDGSAQRYRYNAAMRLEDVGDAQGKFAHTAVNVAANTVVQSAERQTATLSGSTPVPSINGSFSGTTELDSLGRPYNIAGNNGQRVAYRYDSNGNVLSRTDAAGRASVYEYGPLDRLAKVTAPDTGITLIGYDGDGRLGSVTDARSKRRTPITALVACSAAPAPTPGPRTTATTVSGACRRKRARTAR
jgi:YD repeat-containing protein